MLYNQPVVYYFLSEEIYADKWAKKYCLQRHSTATKRLVSWMNELHSHFLLAAKEHTSSIERVSRNIYKKPYDSTEVFVL